MLWIFLAGGSFVGIFFLIIFFIERKGGTASPDQLRTYKKMGIIFVILGIVGCLGLDIISYLIYDKVSQTGNWELELIIDEDLDESFYICESIGTEEYCSFYYRLNNGMVESKNVDLDITTIYEKDDCTPYVVEYTHHQRAKMNNTLRAILAFGFGETSCYKTYEIYIPTGKVLRKFN